MKGLFEIKGATFSTRTGHRNRESQRGEIAQLLLLCKILLLTLLRGYQTNSLLVDG